jgi:hypothetical protein
VASSVELWTVQYSIAYWMFSIITLFLLFNNVKKIIKKQVYFNIFLFYLWAHPRTEQFTTGGKFKLKL